MPAVVTLRPILICLLFTLVGSTANAGLRTWDGRHTIDQVAVTLVYFVPRDRTPLPDWRDRVGYFARRIEQFHAREFQGQSQLSVTVHETPFVSERSTEQLRDGDANAIFYRTLREADERLNFGGQADGPFPILLVLSEINWRPLDDFWRLKPGPKGPEFEGNYSQGEHFPGATSGGARATYLASDRKGWGLVSADGWRVPYRGSDCVVYHEGCGHTVGLPHPEPGNASVMSQGQYAGWISESWLDRDQKARLGWQPGETEPDLSRDLFSKFRALPNPPVPQPGQEVSLRFDWPADAQVKSLRVRLQTDVYGPWFDRPVELKGSAPESLSLGAFERPTPVSYRVDATLADGQQVELWGYFQVRRDPQQTLLPSTSLAELRTAPRSSLVDELPAPDRIIDLLPRINPEQHRVSGQWTLNAGKLECGRSFGARLELPGEVPPAYELTVIAEPLDRPNGLILGQKMGDQRFLVLCDYRPGPESLSALENVDDRNVGNSSTRTGPLFQTGRPAMIQVRVREGHVVATVDGVKLIDWSGDAARLSLGDYWQTPDPQRLFVGGYDCRYRFHRITLRPLDDAE